MYYKLVALNPIDELPQPSWMLSLPATIGRNPDHEVSINHVSISRAHCRLSLNADGALSVRDLDSMNGTYVGDQKIRQAVLVPGDILQLGAISFRVEYDSETEQDRRKAKSLAIDLSTTVAMKLNPQMIKSKSAPSPPPRKWWWFW